MSALGITFEQYEDALVAVAKEIQGDNYAGDDYYRQGVDGCLAEQWKDGVTPEDAVREDMSYWSD
jgi:hypothetical protein